MSRPSRRELGKLLAATGVSVAAAPVLAPFAIARAEPKVVIVGGGAGGATVAHHLRARSPDLDITLIEANPIYSSAFFSNHYFGGIVRALESLNHSYGGLLQLDVRVVHDLATDVDPVRKTVRTRGGRVYSYDRLVLSPGIDLDYGSIRGYSREVASFMPHAYSAGAAQKRLLKRQLVQMRPGGTVVMAVPAEPYACPPAPYERACMIAHFLKTRKPRSKLVILDPKRTFVNQPLFEEAFRKYYRGIVELNLSTAVDDFTVVRVNARTRQVFTRAGKTVRADVANVIPRGRAGEIAVRAGCTEGNWCPVHADSFLSRKAPDIYVLGDAAVAADMPKSAFAANSQAKVVAADILAALTRADRRTPAYRNVCWSLLAPDDSVKLGADYMPGDGRLVAAATFQSQPGEPPELRRQNYQESVAWYASITNDIFAKIEDPPLDKGPLPAEKGAPPPEKDADPPGDTADPPPGNKAGWR